MVAEGTAKLSGSTIETSVSTIGIAAPFSVKVVVKPVPAPLASRSTTGATLKLRIVTGSGGGLGDVLSARPSETFHVIVRCGLAPPLLGSTAVEW